jgi:hypothetical protein
MLVRERHQIQEVSRSATMSKEADRPLLDEEIAF